MMRHRLHREIIDVVKMHQPLLDAIRAKDGEAAGQVMNVHIISSGEFIVEDWLQTPSVIEKL